MTTSFFVLLLLGLAARTFAEEELRPRALDILVGAGNLESILKEPELQTFASCFSLFNSTFVASKSGLVDGHKYTDSVLQFNEASLLQDGFNFQPKRIKLWPDGVVPVRIEPTMSKAELKLIGCAVRWFHENSCVRFVDVGPRETQSGHLYLTHSDSRGGCFTEEMGYQGDKVQVLNLQGSSSCWEMGTIVHELFHVLGFAHEQQREDRDHFITIHHENIPSYLRPQFKKLGSELGIQHVHMGEYDFQSIMHYSRTLPQIGGKPFMSATKEPRDLNNRLMGQRVAPTLKDKEKINLLYHCPPDCRDEKEVCSSLCQSEDRAELEAYLRKNCRKSCGFCGSPVLDIKPPPPPAPKVCELGEWSEWSKCSVSCGAGKRRRSRIILTGERGVCADDVPLEMAVACAGPKCQKCELTAWTAWSECSTSCAGEEGMTYRTRKVDTRPDGVDCGKLKLFDIGKCEARTRCPVDCGVGEWEAWGKCDAVQCLSTRTRFVLREPANGGSACPSKFQTRACNSDCHRQGNLVNLGCLEGHNRCLLLSLKPLNYTAAWQECRSQGGQRLARLDTLEVYYAFKARHEKFKRAFWLWTANPACGARSGHWVGAKVTSSDDWFWVHDERARDGRAFSLRWPSFDQRYFRMGKGLGPAVFVGIGDMRFSNAGFSDIKCGFLCEFDRQLNTR